MISVVGFKAREWSVRLTVCGTVHRMLRYLGASDLRQRRGVNGVCTSAPAALTGNYTIVEPANNRPQTNIEVDSLDIVIDPIIVLPCTNTWGGWARS